ncbi:MAG: hypothetical protein RMJ98_13955 [Myxococcales bacterium]|nr:hypothetical protein [Polyangiaceae bacterium]MDW8250395.1 hypothetical protein [Myxococcales bacterium]
MNATQYEEMLSLLQNIATRLERVEQRLSAREAVGASVAPAPGVASAPGGAGDTMIADDADLDSQWGNPEIRKDPPRWTGPSFVGARYSDTTPEYLESLANFLDWKARESDKKKEMTNNGKPRSAYLRKDAARARGWRKRLLERKTGGRTAVRSRPAPVEEIAEEMPF